MILPALLTQTRSVRVAPGGISLSRTYEAVRIDKKGLAKYVNLFDWPQAEPFPFLYVLAQRAQTALMLDHTFTIAIPGLVHLRNEVKQLSACAYDQPFTLKVTGNVPYKEEGALVMTFNVDYWQAERKVATCTSVYLAKRKRKSLRPRIKATETTPITTPVYTAEWAIHKQLGRQYASASGDINPIHTIPMVARAMGFSRCILHGWYAASRAVREFELFTGTLCRSIVVDFKAPVYLPSGQTLLFSGTVEKMEFQLRDTETGKLTVRGELAGEE